MLYIVKRVINLDRGANGEALSVTFESYFGKKYCLLFSSHSSGAGLSDATMGHAFQLPVLDTYSALRRKAAETGDVDIEWQKESKAISWRDARKILRKLKRQMIGLETDWQNIYEAMLHASKNDGRA